MSARLRGWFVAHAQLLLVGLLPALLLSFGVGRFILNHFFVRAPYALDSGLLSGVAYRSGPLLTPPQIVCDYATSFYQVYFSPIISVFSGLSYLLPVQRIEWFAFVQAVVYFPLGIAVYALASRLEPRPSLRRMPLTILAALAFAFSGLVLWMVGFPHYEAATPGLICLVLVAVVNGRTRLSWLLLGLAASIRQDSGLHLALALMPVLYLKWRGVEMIPSRRRLIVTIAVAIGTSVVAFACQRLLFVPVDRLRPVYFGVPAYAHLSWPVVVERARGFVATGQVIYYPFLASCLFAALRRDARYLLGWAVTVPWFLFNFTAYDGAKSSFAAYTVGPFLVGLFWVYLYGALFAPRSRRLRVGALEAVFTLVCVSSTLGFYRGAEVPLKSTVREMAFAPHSNRSAVHGFVDALHMHKAEFGRLYVDYAVTALAQEWLKLGDVWRTGAVPVPDSIAFHSRAVASGLELMRDLITHQLDWCTHVLETGIFVCSRTRLPAEAFAGVATETLPLALALSHPHRPGVLVDDQRLVILNGFSMSGRLGELDAGRYEWTLTLETDPAGTASASSPARVRLMQDGELVFERAIPGGSHEVQMQFDAREGALFSFRVTAGATSRLFITSAKLRR